MKNAKLLFLALSTLLSGQLLAQQSLEYCNNRFGFCVTYPVDLHLAQDRPINGDGIVLEADGGDIIVNISGAHNVMDWSPEKHACVAAAVECEWEGMPDWGLAQFAGTGLGGSGLEVSSCQLCGV